MTVKVPTTIITFINKDDKTNTFSVVGKDDIKDEPFFGSIFKCSFDVPKLRTVVSTMRSWGYEVIETKLDSVVKISEENPYACFGRRPHPMDFTIDEDGAFAERCHNYDKWEKENNNS